MPYRVGRYEVHEPIASGGMAVVHLGRIVGPVGFSRIVAIKRLHPHLATDPEFVTMFLDEARLAARVQHPNVVATLDVVASHGQLFLVMDFVLGASLSQLVKGAADHALEPPPAVVSSVIAGALYGLHAAHEARDQQGESLGIVHRDVSPHNLLVGVDGVTRVVDFGVAKAAAREQSTRTGQVKGKLAYMAPEQLRRMAVDRRADIYAAGVVLWEALTLRRLFAGEHEGAIVAAVLEGNVPPATALRPGLPTAVDVLLAHALSPDPGARFATARDFAAALEAAIPVAPQGEVGAWVERIGGADIDLRREMVSRVEQAPQIGGDSDEKALEGLVAHKLSPEQARRLAAELTLAQHSIRGDANREIAIESVSKRSSRRAMGFWVGGAIAVVAVTAIGIATKANSFLRRDAPSSTSRAAPRATSWNGPEPPPSLESSPSPESSSSASSVASTGAPAASASATHGISAHPGAASRPHASAPSPHRDGASCDPPFVLDGSGIKRFKPWCI